MTAATQSEAIQIYRVYIKASPEAIWEAITKSQWTVQYGDAPLVEYELRSGGAFRTHANEGMLTVGCPEVISDGEVIEADSPGRLVQTWRMTMTPEMASEEFARLTYNIEPVRGGVTKLTVIHDVPGARIWAAVLRGESQTSGAGGRWSEILSGLKTLLETGQQQPFQSGPAYESSFGVGNCSAPAARVEVGCRPRSLSYAEIGCEGQSGNDNARERPLCGRRRTR